MLVRNAYHSIVRVQDLHTPLLLVNRDGLLQQVLVCGRVLCQDSEFLLDYCQRELASVKCRPLMVGDLRVPM